MTTLDTKRLKRQTDVKALGPSVAPSPETSALITEEQVMFGSAAALAPAPSHRWSRAAHEVTAAVRAMFTRPEKPRHGSITRSGSAIWRTRACLARWTGCDPRHSPEGVFRPTPKSHLTQRWT